MAEQLFLAVGSVNRVLPYFSSARGEGLTLFSFDEDSLSWVRVAGTSTIDNPTFLSVDAKSRSIYANSEVSGWHEGTVSAYSFAADRTALTYLNKQPTLGSTSAHNMVSRDGRFLLVANYSTESDGPEKSVAVFPRLADGSIGPPVASVRLEGVLGPNAERQDRSHAHMVSEVPEGGHVLVADLGLDCVVEFSRAENGALSKVAAIQLPPGSGPRHIAQHANGRYVYICNELTSTVSFIRRGSGTLVLEQTVATIPEGITSHAADIHLSADGRFLYCSNRGHDSIACFRVDQQSGELSPFDTIASGGATPRNFAITPSARHLLVANQDSDAIAIFERNEITGRLTNTGKSIEIGTPVCVRPFVL